MQRLTHLSCTLPLPAHHCCAALVCEALKGLVPDGGRVVNVCSCA